VDNVTLPAATSAVGEISLENFGDGDALAIRPTAEHIQGGPAKVKPTYIFAGTLFW